MLTVLSVDGICSGILVTLVLEGEQRESSHIMTANSQDLLQLPTDNFTFLLGEDIEDELDKLHR